MKQVVKRMLSSLLALALVLSLIPATLAAETANPGGKCGDNVTWSLANGVLTISGSGAMDDYDYSSWDSEKPAPWDSIRESIKKSCNRNWRNPHWQRCILCLL